MRSVAGGIDSHCANIYIIEASPAVLKRTMPSEQIPDEPLREAFRAIIEGKSVKRIRHDLRFEGRDLEPLFREELVRCGYRPGSVGAINVAPGERVPAFYIDRGTAYFGWVFWEQFTSWKLRKLWGSVLKNHLGDWEIQIPATRETIIYANETLRLEMDIDHPPEF